MNSTTHDAAAETIDTVPGASVSTDGATETRLTQQVRCGTRRAVVVKTLRPRHQRDPVFEAMLREETAVAMRLMHAHIINALDADVVDGTGHLVLEHLPGVTVGDLMLALERTGRVVPIDLAFTITIAIGHALDHAHARGVVHRGLGPSTIRIGFDGSIKVSGFGAARPTGVRGQAGRSSSTWMSYLAPEQLLAGLCDHRADLYALGALLWEMLTGDALVAASDPIGHLAGLRDRTPPRPSRRRVLPEEVDEVVLTALAADPAQRFPTASAMIKAVEAVRGVTPASAATLARFVATLFPRPAADVPAQVSPPGPAPREASDAAETRPFARQPGRLARGTATEPRRSPDGPAPGRSDRSATISVAPYVSQATLPLPPPPRTTLVHGVQTPWPLLAEEPPPTRRRPPPRLAPPLPAALFVAGGALITFLVCWCVLALLRQ